MRPAWFFEASIGSRHCDTWTPHPWCSALFNSRFSPVEYVYYFTGSGVLSYPPEYGVNCTTPVLNNKKTSPAARLQVLIHQQSAVFIIIWVVFILRQRVNIWCSYYHTPKQSLPTSAITQWMGTCYVFSQLNNWSTSINRVINKNEAHVIWTKEAVAASTLSDHHQVFLRDVDSWITWWKIRSLSQKAGPCLRLNGLSHWTVCSPAPKCWPWNDQWPLIMPGSWGYYCWVAVRGWQNGQIAGG